MSPRLSPSRLNDFLGCAHHAALWLSGEKAPQVQDAGLELVRTKGLEHEAEVLASLEARLGPAVRIPGEGRIEDRVAATAAAVLDGAPLIYQAAFTNTRWVGLPDFVVGTRTPEGTLAYAPEDAKLSRHAKPDHLLQLGIYARLMLEAGLEVERRGVIHLGGGEEATFDLNHTASITAKLMRRFEAFADLERRDTRALRSSACALCPFSARCEEEWRAEDSPIFVAGMRTSQMLRLETAGVTTLKAMATLDPAHPVDGIGAEAFSRLIHQARLQVEAREKHEPKVELIESEPGKGFALLPPPASHDLYFDMEGDPHYPGGLEYLFGLWGPLGTDQVDAFLPIWAHDRASEKRAFAAFMDTICEHLTRHPEAHIYHYAPYETVALKRLAMQHATREVELDTLLRGQKFVDLYQIVRQSLRASTEGYSLKDLEKIYWDARSGEVTNAGDSIVMYERWRETADDAILADIAAYNQDDVVSTAQMHRWLEGFRKDAPAPKAAPAAKAQDCDDAAHAAKWAEERADEIAKISELADAVRASTKASPRVLDLVAELLWFHERAQKPAWWALFDRQNWTVEELIDDLESIGGARLVSDQANLPAKGPNKATYVFDTQETKLILGSSVKIAQTLEPGGIIVDWSEDENQITLQRSAKAGPFPARASFIPGSPISQDALKKGVKGFARGLVDDDVDPDGDDAGEWTRPDDKPMIEILERAIPDVAGLSPGAPLLAPGADLVDGVTDLVSRLNRSHLIIQGPPGTGKTYTTSHAIHSLMKAGKRVAVSSNSHKAINNLLAAVDERAAEAKFSFRGYKKSTAGSADSRYVSENIQSVTDRDAMKNPYLLLGATAFFLATYRSQDFDYLFVDEAGQVALGNLTAMAGCAKNIVLVGDQMQLPQPVQGVHPGESGLSCLDYLMQDHATVPPERGVLLDVSWRMHPSVCQYISDAFYDGRLKSHPRTAERRIILSLDADPILQETGVVEDLLPHIGCIQQSTEEAERINALVASLLKQSWRNEKGEILPITREDILIVAPYNAQVNLLRRTLPAGLRIGTVDKFQGQEAVVAIVSMATSNGAEAPRGTDFLFNPNRLNVAISRAKCLAILVRGEDLLEFGPGSVKDLRNLEGFTRL